MEYYAGPQATGNPVINIKRHIKPPGKIIRATIKKMIPAKGKMSNPKTKI